MAGVTLRQVRKRFGRTLAVDDVDIEIADGELCVFVGPSGCGKSTLLRLLAGLEEVTSGTILIGGREVTQLPPAKRRVAMVFQSYALYPHMTVADNITFGLRTLRADKAQIARRLARAADMLKLGALLDRKPAQLSGGERQRVAIGRAIVREPDLFLLDEPLSNLDAALRTHMRVELQALHRDLGATMIYVTHDQVEAMTMADRIVVLNQGRVEQAGAPLELYERPANLFVAGFIGNPRMNLIAGRVLRTDETGATVDLPTGTALRLAGFVGPKPGEAVTLGIRPEHMVIGAAGEATVSATAELVEHLGADTIIHAQSMDTMLTVRAAGIVRLKPGEPLRLGLPASACHLFLGDGRAAGRGG